MNSERTSINSKMKLRRLFYKERYEIKKIIQDMEQEFNQDMENLRKENQT
jgi:hypothetical protein